MNCFYFTLSPGRMSGIVWILLGRHPRRQRFLAFNLQATFLQGFLWNLTGGFIWQTPWNPIALVVLDTKFWLIKSINVKIILTLAYVQATGHSSFQIIPLKIILYLYKDEMLFFGILINATLSEEETKHYNLITSALHRGYVIACVCLSVCLRTV